MPLTVQGKTEAEVLASIEIVVAQLAPSFPFGYHDLSDIEQQIRLYSIQLIQAGKYTPPLPLENFLYRHAKNRLLNMVRDQQRRSDTPCAECHADGHCPEGYPCDAYSVWAKRNNDKAGLLRPVGLNSLSSDRCNKSVRSTEDSVVVNGAEISEMTRMVREELPVELRTSYLQMLAGVAVPKARKALVMEALKGILKGELCPNEED